MTEQRKRLPYLKVFGDWLCRFQALDDAQFGRFIRAAIAYVCAGEEPKIDGVERLSFDFIRPALDSDICKYLETVQKRTAYGTKGAAVRWGTDSKSHIDNSISHSQDGKNSQEEERREKKKDIREKREDQRGVQGGETPTEEGDMTFEAAWYRYADMRESIGLPLSTEETVEIMEEIRNIGDGKKAVAMLEMATREKRTKLFPLPKEGPQALVNRVAAGCSL